MTQILTPTPNIFIDDLLAGERGPLFPITPPGPVSGWTWDNQGTSTTDESKGGIKITPPTAANQLRMLYKTAPATPWTFVCGFMHSGKIHASTAAGIGFRQNSTGAIVGILCQTNGTIIYTKWTNATTFSANYASDGLGLAYGMALPKWYYITDNGTNRLMGYIVDGPNGLKVQRHSIGRTDFLTADQYGLIVNDANTSTASVGWFFHGALS